MRRNVVFAGVAIILLVLVASVGVKLLRFRIMEVPFSEVVGRMEQTTGWRLPSSVENGKAMCNSSSEHESLYLRFGTKTDGIELMNRQLSLKKEIDKIDRISFITNHYFHEERLKAFDWWTPPPEDEVMVCGIVEATSYRLTFIGERCGKDGVEMFVRLDKYLAKHLHLNEAQTQAMMYVPPSVPNKSTASPSTDEPSTQEE